MREHEHPVTIQTRIDISDEERPARSDPAAMIDLCNARLADAFDLQTETKQAHWEREGPALHCGDCFRTDGTPE
jgi:hypothetical protein